MGKMSFWLILGALYACGGDQRRPGDASDSGPRPDARSDAGGDAGGAYDSGFIPDIGPYDGNFFRDATVGEGSGDESVRGTALAGITVAWDQPVELCSEWREGQTVAEERANKIILNLIPGARPSLGSGHLSQARVGGGKLAKGPLAAQQGAFGALSGTLVEYVVRPLSGGHAMTAELEYDLGPYGVLVERLQVFRTPGQTDPVRLNDHRFEHFFAWRQGPPERGVLLGPCAGTDDLDDAISVLVAENNGQFLTVTRFARTVEANAGSAPMYLKGMQVWFSEAPYESYGVWGYWPMTYAAEHHNFDDTTHVDFSQDLGWHETLFEPWARGQVPQVPEVLETLDLRGIDGFEVPPQVVLGFRRTADNSHREQVWSANRQWLRVDTAYWRYRVKAECAGGEVWSLPGYGTGFQALVCPQTAAPGFRLVGLVPVAFAADPRQIGQNHDQVQPTTEGGRPGYRVEVGEYDVSITKSDGNYLWVMVRRGGAVEDEFLSEPSTFWYLPSVETLRFSGAGVELTIVRQFVRIGVGESAIYAPVRVVASALGRTFEVEAWDRLDYENTHHNWDDRLTARADDATLEWHTEFLEGQKNTLRILDSQGRELLPLTELEVVR